MTAPPARPASTYADVLLDFARALRAAGVPAGPDRVRTFVAAAAVLDPASRDAVRAAGRATCCASADHVAVFDRVFDAWFGVSAPATRRPPVVEVPVGEPQGRPAPQDETGQERATPPTGAAASPVEALRRRDLVDLSETERAEADALLAQLRRHRIERTTRRRRPGHGRTLDRRATLAASARHDGEIARLPRRTRRRTPRKVVVLVDVSGSMRPYADAYLRFAQGLVRSRSRVEVFTLGTRLTRVTRELDRRDPGEALDALGQRVEDWSGGTRLGDGLRLLVDDWGRRGPLRGALVVIASDGLERGGADELGRQMQRLSMLARDILWCHPHRGRPGFAPATAGMRAALPYVGALLPGHRVADLEAVAEELVHRA